MKAIVHDRYGTADVLDFRDVEMPAPGPDQVLVKVHAASVNPLDWHFMTGTPYLLRLVAGLRRPKRGTRGVDVAGRVEALGAEVSGLSVGDRVFGVAVGSFADYAVAKPGSLALTPDGLDDASAAALPIAAVTALQGLRDHGRVRPGQSVLVVGAAGGVGLFAVQIAASMGAEVTGVCSTGNVDAVRRAGAARVVDYTQEDYVDGSRYDVILDSIGDRPLAVCRDLLAPSGTYVMVSGPKEGRWIGPFRRVIRGRLRFMGGGPRFANFTASVTSEDLVALADLVEAGRLTSVIDRRYSLCDTPEAVRYLATGHARAKVVIDVIVQS